MGSEYEYSLSSNEIKGPDKEAIPMPRIIGISSPKDDTTELSANFTSDNDSAFNGILRIHHPLEKGLTSVIRNKPSSHFEKSYSKDTTNIDTQKELALCYHQKKDYMNALKYYNFALKIEPANQELLANKALTLHAMNNYVAAIELYKDIFAGYRVWQCRKSRRSPAICPVYRLHPNPGTGNGTWFLVV